MRRAPVVHGLCEGTLVRVGHDPESGGRLGQLGAYLPDEDAFRVTLLDGSRAEFRADQVSAASDLRRPGEGGRGECFDLVSGPSTPRSVLAEEVAHTLFEKGFCVLKLLQGAQDAAASAAWALRLLEEGKLARLPEEVEEHYLGIGAKGGVLWLDGSPGGLEDEFLRSADAHLDSLAALLQPYLEDAIGAQPSERTPALLSLSLLEAEEAREDLSPPPADDKLLGVFLGTWRRQLLKVFHFMGPAAHDVSLAKREGPEARGLPRLPSEDVEVSLRAAAGTLLLYRPDCWTASCAAPGRSLLLTASYLRPAPEMEMLSVDGDSALLLAGSSGPPPPPGDGASIMSLAVRMPGCMDAPDDAFTFLSGCTDGVCRIPESRFDIDVYLAHDMDTMDTWQTYSSHMSVVEGAELFDNKEFDITPAEAQGMDVRQRHILEVGCLALAGIGIDKRLANRQPHNAGVGVGTDGWEWRVLQKDDFVAACGASNNALAITANRFSFVYNLKGPNFLVDTACSASLYATHYVRMSLMKRDVDPLDFVLAIGTQLFILPDGFVGCAQAHMLSPEGRCKTFNSTADGYQRGDGTNAFTMRFGDFREERLGILRGSHCNQDGRSASLTAPNGPAQEQCIWGAFRDARTTPPESTVWECHGTGTALGDPIEVGAIGKVQIRSPRTEPLMIGTIKSNIGHLEGGAAMSAQIKCILQVSSAACFATSHLRVLNRHLEHSKFEALFETEGARFQNCRGHSQVSSFGFGGSNGHAIFWGDSVDFPPCVLAAAEKRLSLARVPEVRPLGSNPDDWDSDYPEAASRPGDRYSVTFEAGDSFETPIRWVKEADAPLEPDEGDDEGPFYDIVGNFNTWRGSRLAPGKVPGAHAIAVTVPDSGVLEFRFLQDCDVDKVIAPASTSCRRKLERIVGPSKGLTNTWVLERRPGTEVHIQLLIRGSDRSVMWLDVRR